MHGHVEYLIWDIEAPVEWPGVPRDMTISTLKEIETCPRRWCLSSAKYPALWDGFGYPPRVQVGGLSGTVVHKALEQITRSMVQNGCPSLRDPKAFHVIKTLGGYSQLVVRCIDEALARLAHNPRGKRVSEFANRTLKSKVGELRTQVQTMLSRISLPKEEMEVRTGTTAKGRWPLSTGVYSEIELRAQEIAWKGTIDLLIVTAADCTITDFKTGKRDDCHHFQLSVYALLWHRDRELNPSRRLIDRLCLTYLDGAIEYVAPGLEELEALEDEITARTAAASFSVASIPPEARPTQTIAIIVMYVTFAQNTGLLSEKNVSVEKPSLGNSATSRLW